MNILEGVLGDGVSGLRETFKFCVSPKREIFASPLDEFKFSSASGCAGALDLLILTVFLGALFFGAVFGFLIFSVFFGCGGGGGGGSI